MAEEGQLTALAVPRTVEDVMGYTKAEQETIVRWDREDRRVEMYTSDAPQARQWARLGYDVRVVGTDPEGRPHGWTATGPIGCVRFRGRAGTARPIRGFCGPTGMRSNRTTSSVSTNECLMTRQVPVPQPDRQGWFTSPVRARTSR